MMLTLRYISLEDNVDEEVEGDSRIDGAFIQSYVIPYLCLNKSRTGDLLFR